MIDVHHDVRLDQSETLYFKVPTTDPKAEFMLPDVTVRWRGRAFYLAQIETVRDGPETFISVEADALWYRLGEMVYVGSVNFIDVTPASGLSELLLDTGWTVGATTTASTALFSMESQDRSVLNLIRQWAVITNTYVTFDTLNKRVSLVENRGADRGAIFSYGRNLMKVKRRVTPPTATVLYAYGREGLNIAGVNGGDEFVEDFSWYTNQGLNIAIARELYTKRQVISDDRFLVDTALLTHAQTEIGKRSQGEVVYECEVSEIGVTVGSEDGSSLQVGDSARVSDIQLGFDVSTTVVRIDFWPLVPDNTVIELSSIPPAPGQGSSAGRPSHAKEWNLFASDSPSLQPRNDAIWTTNRLGIRFSEGGEAVYGYDLSIVGVGTGELRVSAYDAENDELVHPVAVYPYEDGEQTRAVLTWWAQEQSGQKDYRMRIQGLNAGSPSASSGIDMEEGHGRFWILARGAVQQTPVAENTITFIANGDNTDTGEAQFWTVPDGVTEITIDASGGQGGAQNGDNSDPGDGCRVVATFSVTSGEELEIYVGKNASVNAGWPDGGVGSNPPSAGDEGGGGGGSSSVRPAGGTFADSLIVAAGGGGTTEDTGNEGDGGDGAWLQGGDGTPLTTVRRGRGATQHVGGAGGDGADAAGDGEDGGFGSGGDGGDGDGGTPLSRFGSGGGGGGWYGGGGGGIGLSDNAGGGGGSSWIDPDRGIFIEAIDGGAIYDLTGQEGGTVTISWDAPD